MSINFKNLWARVKEPVLYTSLGVLLVLAVKNCSDGKVVRESGETIKDVAANVDTIKSEGRANADTVKAYVRATHTVATRTENKVDDLQESADSILAKVDDCCNCKKPAAPKTVRRPVSQPVRRPEPRSVPQPAPQPAPRPEPKPVVIEREVIKYVEKHDTVRVPVAEPKSKPTEVTAIVIGHVAKPRCY